MSYTRMHPEIVTYRNEWINSRPHGVLTISRLGSREVHSLVGFTTMLDILESSAINGDPLPSGINWLPADRDYWQFLRGRYG